MKNAVNTQVQEFITCLNSRIFILSLFIIIISLNKTLMAQDPELYRSMLRVDYEKLYDETKMLTSKLNFRSEGKYISLSNAKITFSCLSEDGEILLGTADTDENGIAKFYISKAYSIPLKDKNHMRFIGRFDGNDSVKTATKYIDIKDGILSVSHKEIANEEADVDSTNATPVPQRVISTWLHETDSLGNKIPVENEAVKIYVARLYGLLPIGEGETDTDGQFTFDFEKEIPGDTSGNILLVIKIEDSDDYGYITTSETVPWGMPVSHNVIQPRALWTDRAPLWMTIAVIIVLGGAWINFIIASWNIYHCFKSHPKV